MPATAATGSAPAPDPAKTKEEARANGVLGPTNSGFDDSPVEKGEGGPDFQAKGGSDASDNAKSRAVQPVVGGDAAGSAKLVLGAVVLDDKSSGAAVTTALTKRLDELVACYQDALGKAPALGGALTLSFTLKPDGTFAEVAVKTSALKDDSLETCLVDSVKAAKLGKPVSTSPVKGSISMTLSPR